MADANATLDISRVLNNTFGVVTRNPVVFLGLSFLIVALPQLLLQFFMGTTDPAAQSEMMMNMIESPAFIATAVGGWLAFVVLSILLQATLIVATIRDLNGQTVELGQCISAALSKIGPLVGMGILIMIGLLLGFMLLVIPGVILALMWTVATPVMMAENTGIIDSLKRSAELTKGSKRWIFLLYVVIIVISFILGLFTIPFAFAGLIATLIVGTLVNTITGAIQGALIASIYVDLKTGKEGADTSELASVFS